MKLDDVASRPPDKNLELTLDEVGLENVQSQIQMQGLLLPARCAASVSLIDKKSRGIHMSRLYKILNQLHEREITWTWLAQCLEQMLTSHKGLSDAGFLSVSFELPVLRKALMSSEHGWRSYPLVYKVAMQRGKPEWTLTTRVLYSSTCPCSAGLSRQVMQSQVRERFLEPQVKISDLMDWLGTPGALGAVPHAQRSEAFCEFKLNPDATTPSALSLIDEIENALGTAVQSAVKREDEQEFARRNAKNLMFCEDAARKLKAALMEVAELADFKIEVRHFESLHPHDVVAKVRKFET